MYILLAEDDVRLGRLIVHMLKSESHTVDWVKTGDEAYLNATTANYDIIILDWMMPKKDGIEVCKALRNKKYQGAILMLTAKDGLDDRVLGLDAGADDYLVKPFEFKELFARIRAVSRRAINPVQSSLIRVGKLTLDQNSHTVEIDGNEVLLTPKEFQLLEILMINSGQILTRDLLIERIWGFSTEITDNNLDTLVRLLRKKLKIENYHELIKNVRGVGYRMEKKNVQ